MTPAWFWIVGGPNGSGKSSLIRHGVLDQWTGGLRALSPDDVVLDLRAQHPDWPELDLLRRAQAISDSQVEAAIRGGTTVMVETVLSTQKFEPLVEAALAAGSLFGFVFVFVTVRDAGLNEARVQNRVARGGHDVPADRIRARRERAHANATWFASRCHVGLMFDNTGSTPVLLAERQRGAPAWQAHDPATLERLHIQLPP